jgi:hypothetical protein
MDVLELYATPKIRGQPVTARARIFQDPPLNAH